jgi:universal stress protein A
MPSVPRKILVAIDFSDPSRKALQFAVSMAELYGASLSLIHVVEPASFVNDMSNVVLAKSNKEVAADAKLHLIKLAEAEVPSSIPVTSEVLVGKPFNEIARLATKLKTDLVVIATHGYTGLKHVMLGSTAERVVRHAPCPVLVVR